MATRGFLVWSLVVLLGLVAVCSGARVRGLAQGADKGEFATIKELLQHLHMQDRSSGAPVTDTEQVTEVNSPRSGVPLPGVDSFGFGYDVLLGATQQFPVFSLQYPSGVYDDDTWSAIDGKVNFAKAMERMEHTTEDYRADSEDDNQTYLIPLQYSARPTNRCSFASSSDFFSTVDSYAEDLSISAGVSIPGAFSLSSTISAARELTDNSRKRLMVSKAKCTSYHVALDDLESAHPSKLLQHFFGFAGLLKCSDGSKPPCGGGGTRKLGSVSDPVAPVKPTPVKPTPDVVPRPDKDDGDSVSAATVKANANFSIKQGSDGSSPDLELLQESSSRSDFDETCLSHAHAKYLHGGTVGACLNGLRFSEGKDIVNPDDAMRCSFLGFGTKSRYQEFCKKVDEAMVKWVPTPQHILRAMDIDGENWPDKEKGKEIANNFCNKKVSGSLSTCSYGPRQLCRAMVEGMFEEYRKCRPPQVIMERSLTNFFKGGGQPCSGSKDCARIVMECVQESLLKSSGCTQAYDRKQSTSWVLGSMSAKDYENICDRTINGFKKFGITNESTENVADIINVFSKESPDDTDKARIKKFCKSHSSDDYFPSATMKNPDSQQLCVKMLQKYAMCARNGLSGLGYDMFSQNNRILGRQIGTVDQVNAALRKLDEKFAQKESTEAEREYTKISAELAAIEQEAFKDNLFNNRHHNASTIFNRLFDSFGTHYIHSADIGGMVNEMHSVRRSMHARNSQMDMSTSFSVKAVPNVGIGGAASKSSSSSESTTRGEEKTLIRMQGGQPKGMASGDNIKDVWADWAPTTMGAGVPIEPRLRSICDLILIIDKGDHVSEIAVEKKRKIISLCNLRMAAYIRGSAKLNGSYTVIMETAMGSQADKILQYRMSTLYLTISSQVTSTGSDPEIVNFPLPNLRQDLDMLNFAPGQITEFEIHGPHLDTLKSISLSPGSDTIFDSEAKSPDMWTYLFSKAIILDRVTGRPYFFKYPMMIDPRNLAPPQVRDSNYPSARGEMAIEPEVPALSMADDPAITVFLYLKNDDRAPSVSKRIFIRLQGSVASVTLKAYIDKKVPYYSNGVWREGSCAENYWIGTKLKEAPAYSTPDMFGTSAFWSSKYKKDMIGDPEALKLYCSNLLVPGGITRLEIKQDQLPINPQWIGKLQSVEIQNYHKDAIGIDKIRVFDGSAQRYMGKGTDKAIYAYTADFDDRFIGFPAEPKSEGVLPHLRILGGRKKVSDKDMPVTNATPVVRRLLTPMYLDSYDQ